MHMYIFRVYQHQPFGKWGLVWASEDILQAEVAFNHPLTPAPRPSRRVEGT